MSKKDEVKKDEARDAELARVAAARAAASRRKDAGPHEPIYRERAGHEQQLQVDHPALLVGCMCGFTVDTDKAPVRDPIARATLYAQHIAPGEPDPGDVVG